MYKCYSLNYSQCANDSQRIETTSLRTVYKWPKPASQDNRSKKAGGCFPGRSLVEFCYISDCSIMLRRAFAYAIWRVKTKCFQLPNVSVHVMYIHFQCWFVHIFYRFFKEKMRQWKFSSWTNYLSPFATSTACRLISPKEGCQNQPKRWIVENMSL